MGSLQEFAAKWSNIIDEPNLPQPLKRIAEFVKSEMEREAKEE